MNELLAAFRAQWKRSRAFRRWTVLALVALVLNLAITILWQLEIVSFEDAPPANDLQVYLEAGGRFLQRRELYIAPRPDFALFAYSPAFAMLFGLLTFLPYKVLWVVDALLHLVAYGLLYGRWFVLLQRRGLDGAAQQLVRLLPLWIVFTGLLYEIAYMNIYIFMALIATLLLEAMLDQQAGKAILCLAILLPTKPQWAFALGVPVLLGQWRFLAKVAGGAVLAYLGIMLIAVLVAGPYALGEYQHYVEFLRSLPGTFPWNTLMSEGHIGYNNSIMQLVNFFTNRAPSGPAVTTAIKLFLSLPLIWTYWRYRQAPQRPSSGFTLEWTFALYLLSFLWLDVVTELTFGILIFSYLSGTLPEGRLQTLSRVFFLPYALTLLWVTLSGIASLFAPLPDIVVDPSLFVPLILIAMVGLYGLVIWDLNQKITLPGYE